MRFEGGFQVTVEFKNSSYCFKMFPVVNLVFRDFYVSCSLIIFLAKLLMTDLLLFVKVVRDVFRTLPTFDPKIQLGKIVNGY